MNAKYLSIAAVMAITLTGFTTSAIAKPVTPEQEQKWFNDCYKSATANKVSSTTAYLGCVRAVMKRKEREEAKSKRVNPLHRFELKQNRAWRAPKQRLRIQTLSVRTFGVRTLRVPASLGRH